MSTATNGTPVTTEQDQARLALMRLTQLAVGGEDECLDYQHPAGLWNESVIANAIRTLRGSAEDNQDTHTKADGVLGMARDIAKQAQDTVTQLMVLCESMCCRLDQLNKKLDTVSKESVLQSKSNAS